MTDSTDHPLFGSALEKFRSHLEHTSVTRKFRRDTIAFGTLYGSNHAALGWMELPFRTVIEAVERLCTRVSKRSIRRELLEVTIRLFEQADIADTAGEIEIENILAILSLADIEAEFNTLVARLKNSVQSGITAYVPISGLELTLDKLQIGNVLLFPIGQGPLPSLFEKLEILGEMNTDHNHKGCYAAVPDLEGDFKYVYETAPTRLLPVLDVLNFYLARCHHRREDYARITVVNRIPGAATVYLDTPSGGYGYEGKLTEHKWYEITPEHVELWETLAVQDIIRCAVGDSSSNSIESRVKRAVTWYSKAVNADSPAEQFIALTIALESLLVGNEGKDITATWGGITQRLADRGAFLLGRNYDERRTSSHELKALYSKRSAIVHSGAAVLPADVFKLDKIAFEAIVAFVQKNFSKWDDFLDWIKEQMYTTPLDNVTS